MSERGGLGGAGCFAHPSPTLIRTTTHDAYAHGARTLAQHERCRAGVRAP